MVLEMLVQIITEPCFNILRTKEQLGYIVFSGLRRANGVQGLRIIVQSERHPAYVDDRIEQFLLQMKEHLENLTEEEFDRHKEALAAQRLEKPKRLSALSARFWAEITSQQYNFDRAQIEVAYLHTLKKSDIIKFFNDLISADSPQRRKLSVYVLSTAEGGAGNNEESQVDVQRKAVRIENITQFKSSQSLYPLVQPFINIGTITKSKL